jgi:hypothetical protein
MKKKITFKQLLETGIMPYTSWNTYLKLIKEDGFPVTKIGANYFFDVKEIELWLKKREQKVA